MSKAKKPKPAVTDNSAPVMVVSPMLLDQAGQIVDAMFQSAFGLMVSRPESRNFCKQYIGRSLAIAFAAGVDHQKNLQLGEQKNAIG